MPGCTFLHWISVFARTKCLLLGGVRLWDPAEDLLEAEGAEEGELLAAGLGGVEEEDPGLAGGIEVEAVAADEVRGVMGRILRLQGAGLIRAQRFTDAGGAGDREAHAEQYGEAVYAPWWETTGVLCAGGV